MAKLEKKYPEFECTEYDYGDLGHREYLGEICATLKFTDEIEIYMDFDFKEFLDYHKRKKTDFHRQVEKIYSGMIGWGSRYFELIELIQEEDDIDLFEIFVQYIESTQAELAEKYEAKRLRMEKIKNLAKEPKPIPKEEKKEPVAPANEPVVANELVVAIDKKENEPVVEEEEDEEEDSPYDRDREKFNDLLKEASNDMYEALKENFFPQMEYFQRRYPSKWKSLIENIETQMQNFEDELLEDMLPQLDENEYREFDIKYNSQKADMSDDDEPPTAR